MIRRTVILIMFCFIVFLPVYADESAGCSLNKEAGDIKISFPENIKGLKKGEVSTYAGDKLYLVIDGEAEIFERYGYLNMQAVSYEGKYGVIQVQVSDMGNNLSAFGLFSYYTNKHGKFIGIGSNGFQEEHSLYFYKGRFFVQVQHLKGKNAGELLENVSREINDILPDEPVKPLEIGYFPTENLIKYTLRYVPKSFMGYGSLPPAFEAYYRDEKGERFRVFILMAGSEEKAEESMAKVKENVKDALMVREGNKVVGAVGFRDKEKTEGLIKKILECIIKETESRCWMPENGQ